EVRENRDCLLAARVDWSEEAPLDFVGAPAAELQGIKVVPAEAPRGTPGEQGPPLIPFAPYARYSLRAEVEVSELRRTAQQEQALIPLRDVVVPMCKVRRHGGLPCQQDTPIRRQSTAWGCKQPQR